MRVKTEINFISGFFFIYCQIFVILLCLLKISKNNGWVVFSTQTWGLLFKTVRNPNLKEESFPNIIITSDSPMRKLCESSQPTRVFISNCSSSSKHGGFYVKNLWLVFCLALCPKMVESPGAGSMYLLVAICLLYTYFILKIERYFENIFKQAARKSIVPKEVFRWSE